MSNDPKGTQVKPEPVKMVDPKVGDPVLFMENDTTEFAAIVVKTYPAPPVEEGQDKKRVNLCVFMDTGTPFKKRMIPYSDKKTGGTWHYPAK